MTYLFVYSCKADPLSVVTGLELSFLRLSQTTHLE